MPQAVRGEILEADPLADRRLPAVPLDDVLDAADRQRLLAPADQDGNALALAPGPAGVNEGLALPGSSGPCGPCSPCL